MTRYNVQVSYKIPNSTKGIWASPITTVHAESRDAACTIAMAKIRKIPEGPIGSEFDTKDIKNVYKFWTFRFDSLINDEENGEFLPNKLKK